jgi:hypothetical protein
MMIDCGRTVLNTAVLAAGLLIAICASASASDVPVSDEGFSPPTQGSFAGVRGTVTDAAGNPLAEVGIAVTAATGPAPDMLRLTAPDGSYSWPLPAGTYSLTANATLGGYRPKTLEVTVPEGGSAKLDFTLEREP